MDGSPTSKDVLCYPRFEMHRHQGKHRLRDRDGRKKNNTTRPPQYGTGFVQVSRAHHVRCLSPSVAREAVVFAMYLLCVLRDTLCLTPVMGLCAHG